LMHILVPTFSYPYFPLNHFDGKFVSAEVQGYAINGSKVRVLTPYYHGIPKRENPNDCIEIIRFSYFYPASLQVLKQPGKPIYQISSLLGYLQIPFLLLAMMVMICRNAKWADIIHAQWSLTALLALPARWLFKTRIVMTARGSDIRLLPKALNRFIHSRVDAAIDCFGPQSWNDSYKRQFPSKYITLPVIVSMETCTLKNQIPDDMKTILTSISETRCVMTYVGRFEPLKIRNNHLPLLQLIEAAAVWRKEGLPFVLFYIGDGSLRTEMTRMVAYHQVADAVFLLGSRTNVMDYLHFTDIGIGGIAFNAVSQEFTISQTAQILIDGVDNWGTPWRHKRNALLIKPGDLADLVDVGRWAILHRDALHNMGLRARKEMDPFMATPLEGGKRYIQAFDRLRSLSA